MVLGRAQNVIVCQHLDPVDGALDGPGTVRQGEPGWAAWCWRWPSAERYVYIRSVEYAWPCFGPEGESDNGICNRVRRVAI